MKLFRIVAVLGLLIFLLASAVTWLEINLPPPLPQYHFSLLDFYRIFTQSKPSAPGGSVPVSFPANDILTGILSLVFAIIAYPIAFTIAIIGIALRRALYPAGIFAVASGVLWLYGLNTLKAAIIQKAAETSGVLGSTIASAISGLVVAGGGPYLAVAGGALMFVGAFLKPEIAKAQRQTEQQPQPPLAVPASNSEMEWSKLNEMLEGFKKKFEQGEISKENYDKLRQKYETELKRIEEKIARLG